MMILEDRNPSIIEIVEEVETIVETGETIVEVEETIEDTAIKEDKVLIQVDSRNPPQEDQTIPKGWKIRDQENLPQGWIGMPEITGIEEQDLEKEDQGTDQTLPEGWKTLQVV